MRKILNILSTINLFIISTTSLVACNIFNKNFNNKIKTFKYTEEELKKLKAENKINTDNQQIKNNLEWIAAQEKPFNQVDNKWYFAIWKPNNSIYWKILKFKHNTNNGKKIDDWDPLKTYYIDLFLWVFEKKNKIY